MVWLKRANVSKFIPWLSLIAFSLMSALVTDTSRLGFGLEQSLASRYTSFSILYIIGLIGVMVSLLDLSKTTRQNMRFIGLIVLAISLPMLFSSYVNGRIGMQHEHLSYEQMKYCTHQTMPSDTCLVSTYPNVHNGRIRLDFVKTKHWAGY